MIGESGETPALLTSPVTRPYLTTALSTSLVTWPSSVTSVATTSGLYDFVDITDMRQRAMMHVLNGITAAALQDNMPTITITGTDDADGTGYAELQVKDAGGNNLSGYYLVRVWIGTASRGAPAAHADFSVTTGTEIREMTADAYYEVMTDSTGYIKMNIDRVADGTSYIMGVLGGHESAVGSVAITGN